MGSGANRLVFGFSDSVLFLSEEDLLVVSTGSGANFLGFPLSGLLSLDDFFVISTGCGRNFLGDLIFVKSPVSDANLLELLEETSIGSGANLLYAGFSFCFCSLPLSREDLELVSTGCTSNFLGGCPEAIA